MKHGAAPNSRGGAMPTIKQRLTVNLDDEDYRELAILAGRNNLSMAWLGRKAVLELLERYRENPHQLPLKFVERAAPSEWNTGPR